MSAFPASPIKTSEESSQQICQEHRSPLLEMMCGFSLQLQQMETVGVVKHGPKWKLAFGISIPGDKIAAVESGAGDAAEVSIYSDGSMIDGGVEGVVVMYQGGMASRVARKYMGMADKHTVFEAELLGAALGAKMIREKDHRVNMLGLDNQATIQTIREERAISGQYLVNTVHEQIEAMRWEMGGRARVTMRWGTRE